MNNAEDNYQIIRQIQDGRDFLLTMLEQNPSLLKTAEPRIRELFECERGENVVQVDISSDKVVTNCDHLTKVKA